MMRKIILLLISMSLFTVAYAQASNGLSLLQVLPFITFLLALITGMLNLYIMNKLGKTKEDILTIVRAEFKSGIHELEEKVSTKEQMDFLKKELLFTMEKIVSQIKAK